VAQLQAGDLDKTLVPDDRVPRFNNLSPATGLA
jgi:hypothetical protein